MCVCEIMYCKLKKEYSTVKQSAGFTSLSIQPPWEFAMLQLKSGLELLDDQTEKKYHRRAPTKKSMIDYKSALVMFHELLWLIFKAKGLVRVHTIITTLILQLEDWAYWVTQRVLAIIPTYNCQFLSQQLKAFFFPQVPFTELLSFQRL